LVENARSITQPILLARARFDHDSVCLYNDGE
jgi:hypothetical protein